MLHRYDNSYITWWNNNKRAWTIFGEALGPDPLTEISARPVPMEPMVRAFVLKPF